MTNTSDQIGLLADTSLKTLKSILELDKEYFSSEDIIAEVDQSGRALGSTLSALSKQSTGGSPFIIPFGKKSMKVMRTRGKDKVEVSLSIQIWQVNRTLLNEREAIIEKIKQILAVLRQ